MKQTPPRTRFKRHLGQTNHYLITTLVALNALGEGPITAPPPELHAAWNPHDKGASVARSRLFVMQASLGWAVDSLDMYLSLLHRKPDFLRDPVASSLLDESGRSVWKKVHLLGAHYGIVPTTIALVDLLIAWRNNVFHELADNQICPECNQALLEGAERVEKQYQGLNTSSLPEKARSGDSLTLKETTSLIRAAHNYVAEIDAAVLASLDVVALCQSIVLDALERDADFGAKYFCLPGEKRQRFVGNWLANVHGLSLIPDPVLSVCAELRRPESSD